MNNWFLVYTKPHKEEYAKKNLLNQNFEAFCPFILKERIQKEKKNFIQGSNVLKIYICSFGK